MNTVYFSDLDSTLLGNKAAFFSFPSSLQMSLNFFMTIYKNYIMP